MRLSARFSVRPSDNVVKAWPWYGLGVVVALSVMGLALQAWPAFAQSTDTLCPGTPVTFPGVTKKLTPVGESYGRPGDCVKPNRIVLHTTQGGAGETADSVWNYFATGSSGHAVNSHFIAGRDGKMLQDVEMFEDQVEVAYTLSGYRDHISIDMVSPVDYQKLSEVPEAQLKATLDLVLALMKQYNIPVGDKDCNWVSPTNDINADATPGIYGDYQLNGQPDISKTDPGKGFMCEFIEAVKKGPTPTPVAGAGSGSGGRIVPYDAFARPYSWPLTGTIRQMYGFTSAAQNLGSRYPDLYPKGDPGVIFSTTNHIEPPPNAKKDKYINPNIDIAPNSSDAGGRAVYATHAGWLTFADWAGEGKGYTIQIESDVEGDGQSDYATRYMHLQAPANNFFAPDVPVYTPTVQPEQTKPADVPATDPAHDEAPLPPPYILEAEAMQASTDKLQIVPDNTASNGQKVLMKVAGTLSYRLDKPADQLIVTAKASQCAMIPFGQGAATLIVRRDAEKIGTLKLAVDTWTTYTIDAEFDGANHTYSLEYVDDLNMGFCDRNVSVDATKFIVLHPREASSQTSYETVIEAESLDKLTGTTDANKPPKVTTDSEATGTGGKHQALAFTSNGLAEGTATIKEGNWVIVRARGSQCEGAPKVAVKIDGQSVLEAEVKSELWSDLSTSFKLAAAGGEGAEPDQHQVSIEFSNDKYVSPLCDRNLYVDSITVQNNSTTQATSNSSSLIGKTKYIAYNQLLGYVSTNRTYEHENANIAKIPDANQSYMSYRIMYNNPNSTTFPSPAMPDSFINAAVDNPYIIETADNTVAGSLKTIVDDPAAPMFFFCANRFQGNVVRCIYAPNPV